MNSLTWRPLEPADAEALAVLWNHLVDTDGSGHHTTAEREAEFLRAPSTAERSATWGAWDGDALVGFGVVTNPPGLEHGGDARAFLAGGVHADHRGRGIGRAIMERLEAEGSRRLLVEHPDRPRHLRVGGGREGSPTERLARARGYECVRFWDTMRLDLADADTAEPQAPEGITLRCPGDADEEPMRLAHEIAFRNHWGSGAPDAAVWHERWTAEAARLRQSTVAVDATGSVLGYAFCTAQTGRGLYLAILGTVPEARGLGLASAVLQRTTHLAAASGEYDHVELHMDSANDTSAPRLYERAGYRRTLRATTWSRAVP